ncbi:MAG: cache domain-containing protein [Alphaproteobacteria bacterium]|nr:cache domain-containing protein [Alphaproteobacteria bacterium]
MNFRIKLLAITILPVVLISLAALILINIQSHQLAEVQGAAVEKMIRDSKESELRNYIKMAQSAVEPFYQWDNVSKIQAQKYVSDVMQQMTFGQDGYFFIFKADGTNLVHPRQPELVGHNWIDLEDSQGRRVISDLIELGRQGGSFYQYVWNKPSSGADAEKLGLSFFLDKWDWMIGSGLYMDDIAAQIGSIRQQLENNVEQTQWVLIVLAVGAVAMTSLLFAVIHISEQRLADSRLKKVAAGIVETQENERKRVSRELHDGISQLLVSARYGLDQAHSNALGNSAIADPIEKSANAISSAIAEIRRISMALRPSVLDELGLAAALKSLCDDFEAQTGVTVHSDIQTVGDLLGEREKTTYYRIAQEALTNIAKHAQATDAWVELVTSKRAVTLEIRDNGVGLSPASTTDYGGGLGMQNMLERIESHGGQLRRSVAPEGGLCLRVLLQKNSAKPKHQDAAHRQLENA